jgi:hypothetical protein
MHTCNMGSYGNMFDIKTLGGEIYIYTIGIYVDVISSVNYKVYTSKLGSFKDNNVKLSLLPMDISQERICDGGWAETWHTYQRFCYRKFDNGIQRNKGFTYHKRTFSSQSKSRKSNLVKTVINQVHMAGGRFLSKLCTSIDLWV